MKLVTVRGRVLMELGVATLDKQAEYHFESDGTLVIRQNIDVEQVVVYDMATGTAEQVPLSELKRLCTECEEARFGDVVRCPTCDSQYAMADAMRMSTRLSEK